MRLYNNMSDDAGAAAIAKVLISLVDEASCCHGGVCMIAIVLIAAMQGNCHCVYIYPEEASMQRREKALLSL